MEVTTGDFNNYCPLTLLEVDGSDPYFMGFQIGQKFSSLIQSRILKDPVLKSVMIPYAATLEGQRLIQALSDSNRSHFPKYWMELKGLSDGSHVPLLEILLLNFRKEISPFMSSFKDEAKECSDMLVLNHSMGIIAHNEDANPSVKDHVYMIRATLPEGTIFTAYTYAGELPSCAFGFNNHGVAFTLNSVPLAPAEVVPGGLGRNFVSRDLLEAKGIDDALKRVQVSELSVGHCYNIMDVHVQRIFNVETASKGRSSVMEVVDASFFHANMYICLEVDQVFDRSSIHRQKRASELPKSSKQEILSIVGDAKDEDYPIYMQGPSLCTLCTVLMDMTKKTLTVYRGNPKLEIVELEVSLDPS